MLELKEKLGSAIILITHDLGVVAETCERVARHVCRAGWSSRRRPASCSAGPCIPTRAACCARCRGWTTMTMWRRRPAEAARRSPGIVPALSRPIAGCAFAPRCAFAVDRCRAEAPALVEAGDSRHGRMLGSAARRGGRAHERSLQSSRSRASSSTSLSPAGCCGARRGVVKAVDGVSFAIRRGETLGLVGESGCGKTTVSRLVLKLIEPTAGRIVLGGVDVTNLSPAQMWEHRRRVQIVFQDPYSSLNPRLSAGTIVGEPMENFGIAAGKDKERRVAELFARVGLRAESMAKYPHEFSGGQRQRLGIAKALSVNPDVIVADEPVSALDVSVRAQVLNLMIALQDELKLAYLFVSHDLAVVRHVSHRIAVMYLGRIVELADKRALFAHAAAPLFGGAARGRPGARSSAQQGEARDPAGRRAEPDAAAERLPISIPAASMRCPSARSPIRRCSRWRRATTWRACGARSAASMAPLARLDLKQGSTAWHDDDEILALSSVELRRRIGTKEISPVELLEAASRASRRSTRAVNAIAATDYARARAEAKAAEGAALRGEPLGPLHGLPTGIKDLHETEGLLTTYGSPLHRDFVPKADAAMVALVRKAGAVIVAKTNVPEFGAGANTRNPGVGRNRQSVRSRPECRRLVGRLGRGAGLRHASGLHGLRHRRLAAHPGRHVRRGGLPAVAGRGADGPARPRLDADLGARPHGADGGRHAPAVLGPGRHGRSRAAGLPAAPGRDRPRAPRRPRPAARRLDRGFRPMPRRQGDPRGHARPHRRHAPPVPGLRGGALRLRRGRQMLRYRARAELRRALPGRLRQGPRDRSGPTCAPTTRRAPP